MVFVTEFLAVKSSTEAPWKVGWHSFHSFSLRIFLFDVSLVFVARHAA